MPKFKKSTYPGHELSSFTSGQDTSACRISGHFLHVFSRKCPETPNLTRFTKSKKCQNKKIQQTMAIYKTFLKVVKIHQHVKFQAIPSMCSPQNARKPQIWPVSLSQNSAKIRTRQIWGIWKLRLAYSPETPHLGQNRWCFVPCDLEIWRMTLENDRASLLCCFKLCATFHSHWWIQTGVTVRKCPIWVKFDDF